MTEYDEEKAMQDALNNAFSYVDAVKWVNDGMRGKEMSIADARAAYMKANICGDLGDTTLCNLVAHHPGQHAYIGGKYPCCSIKEAIEFGQTVRLRW